MTSGTLDPNDVQRAFITKLKAHVPLTDLVGVEIREANWMENEFTYPSVRVDNNAMGFMAQNGNCYGQWFDISVSVFVFTESTSSKACGDMCGLVGKLFGLSTVLNARLQSQPLDIQYTPPIPMGDTFWRGEVIVTGRVKEVT